MLGLLAALVLGMEAQVLEVKQAEPVAGVREARAGERRRRPVLHAEFRRHVLVFWLVGFYRGPRASCAATAYIILSGRREATRTTPSRGREYRGTVPI